MKNLGAYTRRQRIDVVIFAAGNEKFADDKIVEILRSHPRLSVLSMDGRRGTSNYGRFRRSFGVAFQNQSGTRQRSGRCASPHAAIACRIGSRSAPAVVSW